MRSREIIFNVVSAQILGVVLALFFFQYVWPASPSGGPARYLITSTTPYLIWMPLLAVYALAGSSAATKYRRWKWAFAATVGSVVILTGYHYLLQLLDLREMDHAVDFFERCRRSGAPSCISPYFHADPPQPPAYWQWGALAYMLAMIALYAILHISERRARRS